MIEYWKNLDLRDLFYINNYGLVCCEKWKDITGYEGSYLASDLGRVKSLDRKSNRKNGSLANIKGQIMKQTIGEKGYLHVGLTLNSKMKIIKTHQLVAMAFLGHIPCGYDIVVDHIVEENYLDNRLCNIQVITQRRNTNKNREHKNGRRVGATFYKSNKTWVSKIYFKGDDIYLGSYKTMDEACDAYDLALSLVEKNIKPIYTKKVNKKTAS